MQMKRALITGITGQDGSYLADLLLEKGYEVHGIIRRASSFNRSRIQHLSPEEADLPVEGRVPGRLQLHFGDLTDGSAASILAEVRPDEVYHLGAQSHVHVSFQIPEYTGEVTGMGTLRLLEAIRKNNLKKCRFYQASSSEVFGNATETPQRETTPFAPRSPYAAAKVYAHHMTSNYREGYGLFACSGIPFNHESERGDKAFIIRKITRAAARIKFGLEKDLVLGNLDGRRDWGHARDYVEMMWLILQQEQPRDYVIGSGEAHSVREILDVAFERVGLAWQDYVRTSDQFKRPTEVDLLQADPTLAYTELGWRPKTTFKQLVEGMVDHDLGQAERDQVLAKHFGA